MRLPLTSCNQILQTARLPFHVYALVCPCLPLQLAWRYCALHFYERSYESGGRVFETLFTLSVRLTVTGDSPASCAGSWYRGLAAAVRKAGRTLLRLAWSCCMPRTLRRGASSPQPGPV